MSTINGKSKKNIKTIKTQKELTRIVVQEKRNESIDLQVFETSDSGEYHRDAVLVAGIDRFLITNRAAGLDYRRDSD